MGGQPVAGLFPTDRPGFEQLPEAWMSYLAVDDVDARVKKAVAAGAKLMKPDLRRAACRADRDPDRARRRRRRLDDAGLSNVTSTKQKSSACLFIVSKRSRT